MAEAVAGFGTAVGQGASRGTLDRQPRSDSPEVSTLRPHSLAGEGVALSLCRACVGVDALTRREGADGCVVRAANELEAALSCAHVPNHILRVMGAIVKEANIPDQYEQSMNINIVRPAPLPFPHPL